MSKKVYGVMSFLHDLTSDALNVIAMLAMLFGIVVLALYNLKMGIAAFAVLILVISIGIMMSSRGAS